VRVLLRNNGKPGIRQIDDFSYEVTGVVSGPAFLKKRFPLNDPGLYAGGVLMSLLRKGGIEVKGHVRKGKLPSSAVEFGRIKARDIKEIVRDTNVNSLNVAADNLLFLLAAGRYGSQGTSEKGIEAVVAFLDGLGVSRHGMSIADGSGLSPDNRMTSEQVTYFLQRISSEQWFHAFYESLPRAGMDGTLRGLSYRNEHMRAKTGQLDNVYSLAGYIEKDGRVNKAFTYMVNVPGADLLKEKESKIMRLIGDLANE
ncbi:MAG: D-alanyl-D-alanine carboxypeptidase, partial [Deltaproteobacteria bacterium]|nr:D-alanyl-D-alanine carboxypeptidase [Deltaproteobacteria bacterium]